LLKILLLMFVIFSPLKAEILILYLLLPPCFIGGLLAFGCYGEVERGGARAPAV
jgi:hypothetical protein